MSKQSAQPATEKAPPELDKINYPPLPTLPLYPTVLQRLQKMADENRPQLPEKTPKAPVVTQRTHGAKHFHTLILGYSTGRSSVDDVTDYIASPQRIPSIFTEQSVNGCSHLHDAVHFIPQDNLDAALASEKITAILRIFETEIFPRLHDNGKALVTMTTKKEVSLLQTALLSKNPDIVGSVFSTVETVLGTDKGSYKALLARSDNSGNNLLHQAALTDDQTILQKVIDTINNEFGDDGKTLQILAGKKNSRRQIPQSSKCLIVDHLLKELREGTYFLQAPELVTVPEITLPAFTPRPIVTCIPRPQTPPNYTLLPLPVEAPEINENTIERPKRHPMNAFRVQPPSQRPLLHQQRIERPSTEQAR